MSDQIPCHHCDEPQPNGRCWWCGGPNKPADPSASLEAPPTTKDCDSRVDLPACTSAPGSTATATSGDSASVTDDLIAACRLVLECDEMTDLLYANEHIAAALRAAIVKAEDR